MTRNLLIYISVVVSYCSYGQLDSIVQHPNAGQWVYTSKIENDSVESKEPFSGYFVDYSEDSTKICEGNYLNNKKEGEWKFYFKDGETLFKVINFKNSKPYGVYKEYYENGTLMDSSFLDGAFHKVVGYRVRYHENEQVAYKAFYNDNFKEEGKVVFYYNNGQIEFHYEARNGIPIGEIRIFSENGELKETVFCNDQGGEIKRIKEP